MFSGTGEIGLLRRVVIEMPRKNIHDVGLEMVESFKIIQMFKSDRRDYAGICRIGLHTVKDPRALEGHFGLTKVHLISKEKDGTFIAYIEGKPEEHWIQFNSPKEGYQYPPFELTPKFWRKTLLGTERQVERMLSKFERAGLPFNIVSAGEATFTPDSLLMSLTESQRRTLVEAYTKGYFDFPRRTGSEKLSRSLNLAKSTVSEQLRKAEKVLLDQILL